MEITCDLRKAGQPIHQSIHPGEIPKNLYQKQRTSIKAGKINFRLSFSFWDERIAPVHLA
jgi:hypothetical protein